MVTWTLAPNIAEINRDVKAAPWMHDSGTIGNATHLAGSGDHTPYSTHVGKYGYPTQGEIHAQDISMSDYYLDLFETFVRRSWRRGELSGIKYINVLNRHWNIQTAANWAKAMAGTLQPTYSGDHHAHVSMENGSIDGDVIERFKAWLDAGQQFPDEEDDMPSADEVANAVVGKLAYSNEAWGPNPIADDGKTVQSNQNRWSVAATNSVSANAKLDALAAEVADLKAVVASIKVGGVDTGALADQLAQDLALRLEKK